MNPSTPDLNFNYPFEDFNADVKGVEDAMVEKPFGKVPSIKIEIEGEQEPREYAFNTEHPIFQRTQYFHKKYGEKEGGRRNLKFDAVWRFVFGNINLLAANKLVIIKNGEFLFRDDFNDFLKYLLEQRISPKDNTFPKKVVKGFLRLKSGH